MGFCMIFLQNPVSNESFLSVYNTNKYFIVSCEKKCDLQLTRKFSEETF